jgi:F-type H+-transporting ATPase subunit a
MPAEAKLKPGEIDPFREVIDNPGFELSESLHIHPILPTIKIGDVDYQITKFQILLAIASIIVAIMLVWLGRRMKNGDTPRGTLWNAIESLLFFVREKIARAGMGDEGEKYVPFLTTMFLFIFITNILGMIPFLGSATASIAVTFALALIAFIVIHIAGIKENGLFGYVKTFVPHIHLEGGVGIQLMGFLIKWGMAVLEFATAFIRLAVLAIRLFANMLAGHVALFIILLFIQMVAKPHPDNADYSHFLAMQLPSWLYYPVTLFSVAMVFALSLLEIFVAGLQAFIFTLLTSIFIGLAKHPAH